MKKYAIYLVVAVIGICLGRIAVRAFLNFLLGGTLFGGNFL